jgi:Helicase conserved C-terminal domain
LPVFSRAAYFYFIDDNLCFTALIEVKRDTSCIYLFIYLSGWLVYFTIVKCSSSCNFALLLIHAVQRSFTKLGANFLALPTGRGGRGFIRSTGKWSAECYHAGLTPMARKTIQDDFMCGRLRIVVATVAFGMGINKRDIHGVIHYTMPKNIESYVQEVGRAGRDGETSYCHLFLDCKVSIPFFTRLC